MIPWNIHYKNRTRKRGFKRLRFSFLNYKNTFFLSQKFLQLETFSKKTILFVVSSGVNTYGSSLPEVFYKKGILKNFANSQENTCARVSFLVKFQAEPCNFIKNQTRVSKNTFSYRTPTVAAS